MIKKTNEIENQTANVCIFGEGGVGKTRLAATVERPLILSAESGLLSLSDQNIDFWEIKGEQDITEAFKFILRAPEAQEYKTIVVDSLSEIAEVFLAAEKKKTKDGRQAYGVMQERCTALIRSFRDLPFDVYMTAKMTKVQDEAGRIFHGPSLPGKKMTEDLPYFLDAVLCMRKARDEDNVIQTLVQCVNDGVFYAKDRGGRLDHYEPPHLGAIFKKLKGVEV